MFPAFPVPVDVRVRGTTKLVFSVELSSQWAKGTPVCFSIAGNHFMNLTIVVFGAAVRADGTPSGTLVRRSRSAWLFGRQFPGSRYVVSGGTGASGHAEWQAMQDLLLQDGVSMECILPEKEGTDTLGQIRNCVRLLREHGLLDGQIWIATSTYHQARCWLLFRLLGINTRLVRALPDRFDLPLRKLVWFWMREIAALPCDAVLALFPGRG
jgi:uncharacterized SAM-binding protein YcdF (DUF218 family)